MILGIDQTEEDTYYVYDYKGTEKEILKYKGKYNIFLAQIMRFALFHSKIKK